MKLTCTCGYVSKSLIIGDNEKALGEVITDFSKHIVTAHKQAHQDLMKSIGLITAIGTTVAMLAKHSTLLDLPAEETLVEGSESKFIMDKFSEMTDQLQDALGIEVFDSKPTDPDSLVDDEDDDEEEEDMNDDVLDDDDDEEEEGAETPGILVAPE